MKSKPVILATLLIAATAAPTQAGLFRWRGKTVYRQRTTIRQSRSACGYTAMAAPAITRTAIRTTTVARTPAVTTTITTKTTVSGDPYGFIAWLNATRASYGLAAVGHDPNLTNWAAVNNSHQTSRGLGHYVMGSARRQNSAMGHYASIGAMWMNSPAHRAALLDPSIRMAGIAGTGSYWTFNAN